MSRFTLVAWIFSLAVAIPVGVAFNVAFDLSGLQAGVVGFIFGFISTALGLLIARSYEKEK